MKHGNKVALVGVLCLTIILFILFWWIDPSWKPQTRMTFSVISMITWFFTIVSVISSESD
jgi:hypothetical protein